MISMDGEHCIWESILDVRWRERPETINAPEAHRTELSADENSSKKGRSWVSKSCNVARPHDQVQIFRNALDHPQTEFQNFPWQKAALCCMHASETIFPKWFASRFKNSIPKHRANNLPPRIPCFVRKWKTTKAKTILWLWPASTWYRLAFRKFSGHFEVCKLVYLSANFLPVQLVRPLGSDWRSQRSIKTIQIRARIVLTTPWIDWQDKGALERPATWAGIPSQGRTPSDFTRHFFKTK